MTRRRARAAPPGLALAALAGLLLLAGCDAGAPGDPPGPPASALEGEGAAAAQRTDPDGSAAACGPRVVEHRHGATEIRGDPARVVPLSFRDQEAMLALGEVPVAVQTGFYATPYLEWPWVEEALGGQAPRALSAGEVNFEEVAGLRPDLLLGAASGLSGQEYRVLARIAPTVAQLEGHVDFGVPWQAALRAAGDALCRQAAADSLVTVLESELAGVRARNPELDGGTGLVAMAGGPGGAYWVFGPHDSRARFLESLGLRTPPEAAELAGDRFVATLSAERVDLLDADVLVWIATPEQRAALESDPLHRALDVVREGRVVWLESDGLLTAAMTNTTALNLPFLLRALVPRIAAAARGGGAGGDG